MPSRPEVDAVEALRLAARREHELLAISELSRELTVGLDLYALADLVLLNLMGQLGASARRSGSCPMERSSVRFSSGPMG